MAAAYFCGTSTWTTCCDDTWAHWLTTAETSTATVAWGAWTTAEEKARLVAERAEQEVADRRAEELLLGALDAEQKAEYALDKSFHVRDRWGRRYRIRRAWSGHVARVNDSGKEVERFCIHPRIRVPLPDNQLLAKLMIETDEDQFRRTANVTQLVAGAN